MTSQEYLNQFPPTQLLAAYKRKMGDNFIEVITEETILGPDDWRYIAPAWVEDFEQRGMVTLAEIRQQGGFGRRLS